ncbi:MAG: hypothetical protein ACRDTM_03845 [Micromonosporaceae bacterium]
MTNPSFQASQQAQRAAQQASARASQQASMDAMRASQQASMDAMRRTAMGSTQWRTARPAKTGSSVIGSVFKLIGFLIWLAVLVVVVGLGATSISDW